jgi:hypothetical protein
MLINKEKSAIRAKGFSPQNFGDFGKVFHMGGEGREGCRG